MFNPRATSFWIDAGAMQGGARNQLELTDTLAQFFGSRARRSEIVTIQLSGGAQYNRPFVYRGGDDYGHYTDRWRLGLPTANMGGPDYRHRVVCFDKVYVGRATVFQLSVADPNSRLHGSWRRRSAAPTGGTGTTVGGRQYGWWM